MTPSSQGLEPLGQPGPQLREGAAKLSLFHQGQQLAPVVLLPAGRMTRRGRKNTASDTASR
jgi:hypothetical protein